MYLVELPFPGYARSLCFEKDGELLLTYSKKPVDEAMRQNPKLRLVSGDELYRLYQEYEKSKLSEPEEITRDRYWEMLEVLPPCRWDTEMGWFHVSERLVGEIVNWFVEVDGRYFEFSSYSYLSRD